MTIRVLVADDHAVVCKGMREYLEDEPDIAKVGEAGDGQQAVEQAVRLQPDVIVMDVAMPAKLGVEATKRIRSLAPWVHIVALTAYDDEPYVFGLLDAGASGYVLKTVESHEVVRAVRAAAAGQSTLGPSLAARTITRATRPSPAVDVLTEREFDVLRRAARGLTNTQISVALRISDRTVQHHLAHVYATLEVASHTEAVTVGVPR